jgi:hypothetical protein
MVVSATIFHRATEEDHAFKGNWRIMRAASGMVVDNTVQAAEYLNYRHINVPTSRDAAIRVYTCPACLHERRLTVWAPDQAA